MAKGFCLYTYNYKSDDLRIYYNTLRKLSGHFDLSYDPASAELAKVEGIEADRQRAGSK